MSSSLTRASSINPMFPARTLLPPPTGSIGAGQRAMMTLLYGGIAAAAAQVRHSAQAVKSRSFLVYKQFYYP